MLKINKIIKKIINIINRLFNWKKMIYKSNIVMMKAIMKIHYVLRK
jgi:hypothetical protein